ncbi:MAG: hypothetical protein P1V97_32920 [Planctomycetota bacterium]|nr:hypothetical protein [Planctomycetota bacterium]
MKSNEEAFIRKIDCAFPYTDFDMAEKLIEEACAISANAAFMVLYELSNPGKNADYPFEQIQRLLSLWEENFDHPLKDLVLSLVSDKLNSVRISDEDIITAMLVCAEHGGPLMALNTVFYCLRESQEDTDSLYESISQRCAF